MHYIPKNVSSMCLVCYVSVDILTFGNDIEMNVILPVICGNAWLQLLSQC